MCIRTFDLIVLWENTPGTGNANRLPNLGLRGTSAPGSHQMYPNHLELPAYPGSGQPGQALE